MRRISQNISIAIIVGIMLSLGTNSVNAQLVHKDATGDTQPQQTSISITLEELARGCSVGNLNGRPVKFYPTALPTSYNLTSEEVCTVARKFSNKTSEITSELIDARCRPIERVVQSKYAGDYFAAIQSMGAVIDADAGEIIPPKFDGPEAERVFYLVVTCRSAETRNAYAQGFAKEAQGNDLELNIYSFGTFKDNEKTCLGYLSEVSGLTAHHYILWGYGDCEGWSSDRIEHINSLPDRVSQSHGQQPKGDILSAFQYDGAIPEALPVDAEVTSDRAIGSTSRQRLSAPSEVVEGKYSGFDDSQGQPRLADTSNRHINRYTKRAADEGPMKYSPQSTGSYINERFSFSVKYPGHLLFPQGESDNGDGQMFFSKDAKARLTVSGIYQGDEDDTLERAFAEDSRGGLGDHPKIVTYKRMKDNWYVVSGYNDGAIFYSKRFLVKDTFVGFAFTYPENQRSTWDSVVEQVAKGFSPDR